jgi:hypothetical protein
MAQMQEDKKAGKSNPANEYAFQNRYSQWLNDKDVHSSFDGSYVTPHDWHKDVQEAVKTAHEDGATWMEDAKNEDGTVNADILLEKSRKGLLSGKVKNILDEVFSRPEVSQQLQIEGVYHYRDYSPEMLAQETNRQFQGL